MHKLQVGVSTLVDTAVSEVAVSGFFQLHNCDLRINLVSTTKTVLLQQLQSLIRVITGYTYRFNRLHFSRQLMGRQTGLVSGWLALGYGINLGGMQASQFAEADPGSADQCLDSFLLPADSAVLPLLSQEHKAPSNLPLPPAPMAPVTSTFAYYTDLDRKTEQHDCSLMENKMMTSK